MPVRRVDREAVQFGVFRQRVSLRLGALPVCLEPDVRADSLDQRQPARAFERIEEPSHRQCRPSVHLHVLAPAASVALGPHDASDPRQDVVPVAERRALPFPGGRLPERPVDGGEEAVPDTLLRLIVHA